MSALTSLGYYYSFGFSIYAFGLLVLSYLFLPFLIDFPFFCATCYVTIGSYFEFTTGLAVSFFVFFVGIKFINQTVKNKD